MPVQAPEDGHGAASKVLWYSRPDAFRGDSV
jgi:hypothetical protein